MLNRICDEDEDVPLHLRIKYTRSLPSLYSNPDTKVQPTQHNVDEYEIIELFEKIDFVFYFSSMKRYWCATHVFQTQYVIQIVRCTKPECCGPWRSNYIQVFPHRFLPPPVPFDRSFGGVRLAELESSMADLNPVSPYYGTLFQRIQFHGIVMEKTNNLLLPFDFFCPSIQTKLHSRICSICKQYIPTASRLRNHYRVHQQRYAARSIDVKFSKEDDELIDEPEPIDLNDLIQFQINPSHPAVSIFADINEWLRADFEEDPVVETKTKTSASVANMLIRQERQLQEAAAAAIADVCSITNLNTQSSITIGNSNESKSMIPLTDIKTESIENETVTGAMQHLAVSDSCDLQSDNSLNQFDDLGELVNQI